uniref:Transmembrane protein n=1 Tax=Trepomonas sp. PC1 TaxID=1076344 RepID=A0A146KD89_9EUKA|eukprot:JAP94198.1 hypothetical protein TPC1_13246 [Trepomonas sp. PC1]
MYIVLILTLDDDIQIFDKCFSPQSVVVGNKQLNTFDLILYPYEKMNLLNSSEVRNMCEVVFFDAKATVALKFDVAGVSLEQVFKYIYNSNQTITFQLSQTDFNTYSVAKYVYYTVTFPGQQPISFGVQSLRFLKKDYANCYSEVKAEYSRFGYQFLSINVTPSNCNIDVSQTQVYFESTTLKLLLPPCTSNCSVGQYGSTSDFISTTLYVVNRDDLTDQDDVASFDAMMALIEANIYSEAKDYQLFQLSARINDDVIQKDVEYVLMSDRDTKCAQTMSPHVIYNRVMIRAMLYGTINKSRANTFECYWLTNNSYYMNYGVVMRSNGLQQTTFMLDEYLVFAMRNGGIIYGDCTLNLSNLEPLSYDLIFLFQDEQRNTIAQFSRHGAAFTGCFYDGVLIKYPEKICLRVTYVQNDICKARYPFSKLSIRTYIDFDGDRTQRKWFSKLTLPSVELKYNSTAPQIFCFTCDNFDPSSSFYGDTCENSIKVLGDNIVKQIPYVEISTAVEISRFWNAASYQWANYMWPGYIVFGATTVIVAVAIVFMIKNLTVK